MSDVIATEARPPEVATKAPILEVDHLAVTFYTPRGTVRAVRDASLEIHRGEVLGLVGESGCGKSTVALAVMGYLPGTARIAGSITFEGRDIAAMSDAELSELRGNRIAMVYQDPATSLNPTMRVGPQVEEVLREHLDMDAQQARERAAELFDNVGLAGPRTIGRRYPHQLSGGMQQRVVIAMALACDPDLLIMDEPTTGLDVTTEATIIDLVVDLKERVDAGILFATHNLGVIARVADRVSVMYAGQTVEQARVRRLFARPQHPYTAGLLSCVPKPPAEDGATVRLRSIPGAVYAAEEQTTDSCLFAPRCPIAQGRCREEAPSMLPANGGHEARCFFSEDVRAEIWGASNLRPEHEGEVPAPVLSAKDLRQFYGSGRRKYVLFGPLMEQPVRAVVDIDFEVARRAHARHRRRERFGEVDHREVHRRPDRAGPRRGGTARRSPAGKGGGADARAARGAADGVPEPDGIAQSEVADQARDRARAAQVRGAGAAGEPHAGRGAAGGRGDGPRLPGPPPRGVERRGATAGRAGRRLCRRARPDHRRRGRFCAGRLRAGAGLEPPGAAPA